MALHPFSTAGGWQKQQGKRRDGNAEKMEF
jgi:hypothetical protein